MGIADYGTGQNDYLHEYDTTSFLGIVSIDSLGTYNSSLNYINYFSGVCVNFFLTVFTNYLDRRACLRQRKVFS